MRAWEPGLAAIAVLAIVGVSIWGALTIQIDEPSAATGYKRLSGTVAEGFVYRAGTEKFPRASCGACRVGKAKMGVFSIGALDTLEMNDLVVNLPPAPSSKTMRGHADGPSPAAPESGASAPAAPNSGASAPAARPQPAEGLMAAFQLQPLFGFAQKELKKNFASLRIKGFAVNRLVGDGLELVVSADLVKNKGRRIFLYHVSLNRGRAVEKLPMAELVLRPQLKIVWPQGSFDLTHVMSDAEPAK